MRGVDSNPDEQPGPPGVRLAQEIRRLRKSAGLSQPDLAAMVGYTPQYISLAERPRKGLPSAIMVQAVDRALGANGALVELRERAGAQQRALRGHRSQDVALARAEAAPRADEAPAAEGGSTSHRRDFLAVTAAIAFGAALDLPTARIIAQADQPRIPATVRSGDVRDLHAATEMLEVWGQRAGGAAVRHHVLGALRWSTGLLDGSCTPGVRRELAAAVARLADLAAWETFDAGLNTQARELSLLGLSVAHESGDPGMRAHVASRLAVQQIHTGSPDAALDLVQLAHAGGDALTANAVSMLHSVKACAYAKKPDASLCHRSTRLAADRYRPESAADDPPWLRYFTPEKLAGRIDNALFDLLVATSPLHGNGPETKGAGSLRVELATHLSDTVASYPDSRTRSKAMLAARLATVLYLEGEPAEANKAGATALGIARDVRSARLGMDLRVLARATGAAPRDPLAQSLRTEANALAAGMT